MVELQVSIEVNAPAERVFAAVTDWAAQGEWMPGTQVFAVKGRGAAVGDEIVARTALAKESTGGKPGRGAKGLLSRAGFNDPLLITAWEPPVRCEVRHLGNVVRGTGVFEVAALDAGRARYTWIERVDPPFGRIGEIGLLLARRPTELALRIALRRFARWVEQDR